MSWPVITDGRPVTAVTHVPALSQVIVEGPSGTLDPDTELRVFEAMASSGISVDLDQRFARGVRGTVLERQEAAPCSPGAPSTCRSKLKNPCAKVSVVRTGMRGCLE